MTLPPELVERARTLGVHTSYTDGLGRAIAVGEETLAAVCDALGAEPGAEDAAARRALPPVLVAWDGHLAAAPAAGPVLREALLTLEGGAPLDALGPDGTLHVEEPLPFGYHRLVASWDGGRAEATVIAAPTQAWRPPGSVRGWGVAAHLAALRSSRSRAVGDLRDLVTLGTLSAGWGASVVSVLPLLPTFNTPPPEPSPYAPVSRLFWSELILDLGAAHVPVQPSALLDVGRADAEVRRALAGQPDPDRAALDPELARYARFRGAQARLGRNWRAWPAAARDGHLDAQDVDPDEERFHLVAQLIARRQLGEAAGRLEGLGIRLGLDLAVGAHPDGYDTWSRQALFARGMSVGAPPDPGFPSGQDWGFAPVLPEASRREGHRYLAAAIAHQAAVAGILRVDHVMALSRLYWIPHGMDLDRGTYVTYPAEELFAVLTLESHRHRCEVVGENLGTVPDEIRAGLPRHGIRGMYVSVFEADAPHPRPPSGDEVAHLVTHDTPTLAGWVAAADIDERVRCGLLDDASAPGEHEARAQAVRNLEGATASTVDDLASFRDAVLGWLARSEAPLVMAWLEDLWLEPRQVNLPGTPSSARPNWQRPMSRLVDHLGGDEDVARAVRALAEARTAE